MNTINLLRLCCMSTLIALCPALPAQQIPAGRAQRFAALPVWTGLWEPELSAQLFSGELDKDFAEEAKQPDRPAALIGPKGALDPVEQAIFGHVRMLDAPPYNAAWQRRYEMQRQEIANMPASRVNPDDVQACHWQFPLVMEFPFDTMFELLVTPEQTLLLFQNGQARHLYTDREHPPAQDLWPTDMGHSVGHWENDTLVVDTIAAKSGPILGLPDFLSPDLSEQARFTERLRMIDADTLQDEMSIDDPLRFTAPWKLTLRYRRVKNLDRLITTDCTENNRFRMAKGRLRITP